MIIAVSRDKHQTGRQGAFAWNREGDGTKVEKIRDDRVAQQHGDVECLRFLRF